MNRRIWFMALSGFCVALVGGRAEVAKGMLRNAGFASLYDLRGHMAEWERLGYPVERATDE